jgi:hypothetical protein
VLLWACNGRVDIASGRDARMRRVIEHLLCCKCAAITPDDYSAILKVR